MVMLPISAFLFFQKYHIIIIKNRKEVNNAKKIK